jgi:hypothetical protein
MPRYREVSNLPASELKITFRYTATVAAIVIIEPWAEEYEVSSGKTVEVTFIGPNPADLEVRVERADLVVVYGWGSSTYCITIDGIVT